MLLSNLASVRCKLWNLKRKKMQVMQAHISYSLIFDSDLFYVTLITFVQFQVFIDS
jgi:hypothetical protein